MLSNFENLIGKSILLTNINGLLSIELIEGVIKSVDSPECVRMQPEKELRVNGEVIQELTIYARHKGYPLTNLNKKRMFFLKPIIAVNVQDSSANIRFVAEVELKK